MLSRVASVVWLSATLLWAWPALAEPLLHVFDRQTYTGEITLFSEALAEDSDTVEYYEVFFESDWGLYVLYVSPSKAIIAERWVMFRDDKTAPTFRLIDYRHGSEVGVKLNSADELLMYFQESPDHRVKQEVISNPSIVVDAGFNDLILANWTSLFEREQALPFTFAFPKKLMQLNMLLKPKPCEPEQAATVCLALTMQNRLFRLIAGDTMIRYDAKAQRLLGFDGLSNISSADKKPLKVRLRYYYEDLDTQMRRRGL